MRTETPDAPKTTPPQRPMFSFRAERWWLEHFRAYCEARALNKAAFVRQLVEAAMEADGAPFVEPKKESAPGAEIA